MMTEKLGIYLKRLGGWLLTIEDVAELCGVCTKTVRRWEKASLLPPRLRVSRTFYYRQTDIFKLFDGAQIGQLPRQRALPKAEYKKLIDHRWPRPP